MSGAPAVERSARLLRLLAEHGPTAASTLAAQLGLARSSTYVLLDALESVGLVAHGDDQRWALGVGVFELGSAYLRQAPLERAARPLLTRLTRHPVTAHLGVLDGTDVLYLLREGSRWERARPGRVRVTRAAVGPPPAPVTPAGAAVHTDTDPDSDANTDANANTDADSDSDADGDAAPPLVTAVGVRLPAHLTASGRAILAALPAAQLDALYPRDRALADRTGAGPRSVGDLRALLDAERGRGWAREDGHVTAGLSSVAAVAYDHLGRPVCAISITALATDSPRDSADGDVLDRLVPELRRTADTLTGRLRGRRGLQP